MANSKNRVMLANYLLGQQASTLGKNYVLNSMALQNINNVTASGATLSRNTTTPLTAISDFSVALANNTTDKVTWTADTLDNALKNQNCELRFDYTASSIGSNVVAQVLQGTNVVGQTSPLTVQSSAKTISLNVPCGDLSQSTTVVIANGTGNSGTSSMNVANVTYGKATNVGNVAQAAFAGSMFFTPETASCNFSITQSTYASDFSANASCPTPTVSGNITSSTKTPQAIYNNAPPGTYQVIWSSRLTQSATANAKCRIVDELGNVLNEIGTSAGSSAQVPITIPGFWTYSTAGNHTWKVQCLSTSGSVSLDAATTDEGTAGFQVYRFPYSSEIAYRPEIAATNYTGTLTGSGGGWSTTSASYTDFSVATTSTTLTNVVTNGSITCTAESTKLPAITCSLPMAGSYLISATASPGNGSAVEGTYTRLVSGTTVINGGILNETSGANIHNGSSMIGLFSAPSVGSYTFKIQGKSEGGSTGSILQDPSAPITWTIIAMPSIAAPVLIGSVTSSTTGSKKIDQAFYSATCSSGTCVADWADPAISSVTVSSSIYTVNFLAGSYTIKPACHVTCLSNSTATVAANNVTPSTSSWQFVCKNSSFTNTNDGFMITCGGPR